MARLAWHIEPLGDAGWSASSHNLAFVFQVNCPGCFLYGIPLVNRMQELYGDRLSIVGVSTAFEDFEYNNLTHTRALLDEGTLVGETARVLREQGLTSPPAPQFPVVMDRLIAGAFMAQHKEWLEHAAAWFRGWETMPEGDRANFLDRLADYYRKQAVVSLTFSLNQLQGTPSLLFFDQSYEVKGLHFGHIDAQSLQHWLHEWLPPGSVEKN